MALEIALEQGARAHVTTQSATKIHSMDANYAAQTQTLALADDAYLEFLPDPIIPHRRARFVSDTQISVAPSATLLYAEISSRVASITIRRNASARPFCRWRSRSLVLAAARCSPRSFSSSRSVTPCGRPA